MKTKLIAIILLVGILSCKSKTSKVDAEVYYTCSMDPQVISVRPGSCPICKMELTAVRKSTVSVNDDLQLSDQQIRLANILIDTIGLASKSEQNILLATVNLDYRKATLSSQICSGHITREEAMEELKKPTFDTEEIERQKDYIAKKLGISLAELDKIIDLPGRYYYEYPNDEKKLTFIYNIYKKFFS